jgi:hypothetical protein
MVLFISKVSIVLKGFFSLPPFLSTKPYASHFVLSFQSHNVHIFVINISRKTYTKKVYTRGIFRILVFILFLRFWLLLLRSCIFCRSCSGDMNNWHVARAAT